MTFACFALPTVGINVDTGAQVRLTSTAEAQNGFRDVCRIVRGKVNIFT